MLVLATRGVGGIEFVRALLPDLALSALALLTWLGSIPLLVGLSALVYWYESREGGALALAAVLGAYALTVALKATFGLPRPPESLWLVEASGFGFPSGHAIAATVGWGALAVVGDRWSRRSRFGVATVVVLIVVLSRVAIGVHYAADVLAGLAVGVAYLGLVVWLDEPGRAFGVATGLALLASILTAGGESAVLVLGGAAGSWLAWTRLSVPEAPWDWTRVLPGLIGGAVAFGLLLVTYRASVPVPVAIGIGGLAFAGVLGLPALVDRLEG